MGAAQVRALSAVIAALLLALWSAQCRIDNAYQERDAAQLKHDSLAAEAAVERARANGWEASFGTDDPEQLAARLDSIASERARDLEASNVRVSALTSLVSELRDSVRVRGRAPEPVVIVDTVHADTVADAVVTGEWTGEIREDLIDGDWSFRLPEVALDLSFAVRCPATLVSAESGDGRVIVFARGDDERCRPMVNELLVDVPDPVIVRRNGFFDGTTGAIFWSLLGAGAAHFLGG